MKKENLRKNLIVCGIILIAIVVIILLINIASNTNNKLQTQNQANVVQNELDEKVPENDPSEIQSPSITIETTKEGGETN